MKQQCVGLLLVCDDLTQSARSLVAYIHVPMVRYSVMEEVKFFVLQCGNEIVNYYVIVPCRKVVLFSEVCFQTYLKILKDEKEPLNVLLQYILNTLTCNSPIP